jgi:hypothetical protein
MSLIDLGTTAFETNVPKPISPSAHGLIDYGHAAFFLTVGLVSSRSNRPAASAAFATGGFILVQSLLTDYRFGLKPVISFETHGKMDTIFAASSWMIPVLFGFSGTKAATIFEGNSLAEASVLAMTDWNSQRAH